MIAAKLCTKLLKPMLEKETGLPVVGCLPPLQEAAIESRHLGSENRREIADLQNKIKLLSDAAQKNHRRPHFAALFDRPRPPRCRATCPRLTCAFAVARDAAFCFTYAETLEVLQEKRRGAVLFQPAGGYGSAPNIGGLYLPGGYPELYAAQLAANAPARRRKKRRAGRPAHRGRVRRLFVPGPDITGRRRHATPDGGRAARARLKNRAACAVRLCPP